MNSLDAILSFQETSFDSWYPLFKNHTFTSVIIPLSKAFLLYLSEDGIIIPKSIRSHVEEDDEIEEDVPEFDEIQSKIKATISKFGHVFPKLNWSAPKDSVWILPENIIKCDTVEEVFLALKSSDIISNDLDEAYDGERVLVLKKYVSMDPSKEFRLFVDSGLVGISQRECTTVYPSILQQKKEIQDQLEKFFECVIFKTFPLEKCMGLLSNLDTVDLFLSNESCLIVDFNVWGDPTESLLFDWQDMPKSLEFRVVEKGGIRPSISMYSRLPYDLIDARNFENIDERLL